MKILKTTLNLVLTTSLLIPSLGFTQTVDETAPATPVVQAAVPANPENVLGAEQSRTLSVILSYLDEFSYSYKIDYPWIERGPKQSDFEILSAIESRLKEKFSDESNSQIHPGWINSQSITFERREVCVEYGEIITKDNKQRYKSSDSNARSTVTSTGNTVSNTVATGVALERRELLSSEKVQLAAAANNTVSNTRSNGNSFSTSGYTIYEITEKEKLAYCKKTKTEFRGTLQSEKILHAQSTAPHVKFYLVHRAVKALVSEFKKTLNKYVIHLNYILNTPGITEATIESMKLQNADQIQNTGSSGLVEYFSSHLISLVTVYKRLGDIIELANNTTDPNFKAMTKNTERAREQLFLGLMKVSLTLEPYGRQDRVIVTEGSWGKKTTSIKTETVKEVTIGVIQDSQGTYKPVTLFRESELKLLFAGITDFSLKGEKLNPVGMSEKESAVQKERAEADKIAQQKREEEARKAPQSIMVGSRIIDKQSGIAGTVEEVFSNGSLKIVFDTDRYRLYVRSVDQVAVGVKR